MAAAALGMATKGVPMHAALSVIAGVTMLLVSWRSLSPVSCKDVAYCAAIDGAISRGYHGFYTMGLVVLFVREASGLVATFVESQRGQAAPGSSKDPCLAQFLLCLIIFVLTLAEASFSYSEFPWAHASPSRPVYTLRYMEWCHSVPLLLTLSGYCALGRSLAEVVTPIIVTEVYMLMAMFALLVQSDTLRLTLILGTFVGYGWASRDMFRWASKFLEEAAPDAPCRKLRISSAVMLVVLFAFYGVVYLGSLAEVIHPDWERFSYATMGFSSKVVMSMIFTAIRVMEHKHTLNGLLSRISGLSTAFMSLLRGSFDLVIPCSADANGTCQLPVAHVGDSAEFERRLGRPVLGMTLNELLAGSEEKKRFGTYVQNALRQAEGPQSLGKVAWQVLSERLGGNQGQTPPVAQVLHIKLRRSRAARQAHKNDGDDDESKHLNAAVHLSMVPQSCCPTGTSQQMVVGLRFDPEDRSGPPTPPLAGAATPNKAAAAAAAAVAAAAAAAARLVEAGGAMDTSLPQQAASDTTVPSPPVYQPSVSGGSSSTAWPVPPPPHLLQRPRRHSGTAKGEAEKSTKPGKKTRRAGVSKTGKQKKSVKMLAKFFEKRLELSDMVEPEPAPTREGLPSDQVSVSKQSEITGTDPQGPFRGAWEAGSQSSKLSHVGSVTMACRQLLGPLHDHLPPKQLVSKRVEDHVQCAAEMVRLRANAKIKKLHQQQQLAEWEERKDSHIVSSVLTKGAAPTKGIDDQVWRTQLLPHLEAPHPGEKPEAPAEPDGDELWHQAWQRTYEEETETESTAETEQEEN